MSDQPSTQLERQEYQLRTGADMTCTQCKRQVFQSYYVRNDRVICATCREQIEQGTDSAGGRRMAKAFFAGLGVALLGSIVWFAVAHWMDREFALLSIAIGYCVGMTVRWASGDRGGRAYQFMAVALTYFSIVSAYVPFMVQELVDEAKQSDTAKGTTTTSTDSQTAAKGEEGKKEDSSVGTLILAIAAIIMLAAVRPFLGGFENIFGIVIIAFGLWRAWVINRRVTIAITGPHSVAPIASA